MADPSSEVQVLLSFSTFSRPTTVPSGSGYEVLNETFVSVYGRHIDVLRKFIIQIYSDEWGQYIDFPKGFTILNQARLRLVPLQSEVRRHHTDMVCLRAFHNKAFPNSCFCIMWKSMHKYYQTIMTFIKIKYILKVYWNIGKVTISGFYTTYTFTTENLTQKSNNWT